MFDADTKYESKNYTRKATRETWTGVSRERPRLSRVMAKAYSLG
jgi:hypothetical protein